MFLNDMKNITETSYSPITLFPRPFKRAFTLAEVLITLGIIGVVAAMTLPAIIWNYQKMVTVNRLKKSYTTISQMITMSQKDNGDVNEWNLSFFGENNLEDYNNILTPFVKQYFLPYLRVSNDCGIRCGSLNGQYKLLGKDDDLTNLLNRFFYTIYLQDGTIIFVALDNNTYDLRNLIIYVDINGAQKPNIVGIDVFSYYFTMSNIARANFWGLTGATVNRNVLLNDTRRGCNKSASGEYCGALIQYDNWQIKDDYPWR